MIKKVTKQFFIQVRERFFYLLIKAKKYSIIPSFYANRHFSYVRYNADLSQKGLEDLHLSHIDIDEVRQMDSVKHMKELSAVGKTVGSKQVNVKEHFKHFITT